MMHEKARKEGRKEGSIPFRVEPDQSQFFPDPIDHVLHAEIELTTHHGSVGLMREFVQEVQADAIDLVVHVEAADVFPVILHDNIDEIVDRCYIICGQ